MASASLTLTSQAAQRIQALLQKKGISRGFLRLRVTAGGCSGFSYEYELSEDLAQGDQVFEAHGSKVVADAQSFVYLSGSQLDYTETLMRSGFELKNPNATGSCACGSSFSIEV
ncbi:MAG: iron-sulfur cluster assembly accessory protein [Elusimicrobia bacterium]|nr:iron-sulfur cluster assembly accessory protein [Elusimicrobiota bacterium]